MVHWVVAVTVEYHGCEVNTRAMTEKCTLPRVGPGGFLMDVVVATVVPVESRGTDCIDFVSDDTVWGTGVDALPPPYVSFVPHAGGGDASVIEHFASFVMFAAPAKLCEVSALITEVH